jgi:hypothetical protein
MKKKLLIIGHARHGKDTVCEMLQEYGYTFKSSSLMLLDEVIFPWFEREFPGKYNSREECFTDKVNNRERWFTLIAAYNYPDKAKLAKLIMSKYDIYCGLRGLEEFNECKSQNLFDLVIWVDASERKERESKESMQLEASLADIVLDNNGSMGNLRYKVNQLVRNLHFLVQIPAKR